MPSGINYTKISGWLTFLAGILIIVFSLYSSYNIFTGKAAVPEFFEKTVPSEEETPSGLPNQQEEVKRIIGEQLKEILPADTLTRLLNLAVWSILAGILIFGGAQIASLGIRLIKD